jgi:hypothetical protein
MMVSVVVRRFESVRASSKPPNTKATPTITPKTPVNVPLSVRNKSPMDRPSTASGLMPTRLPEKKPVIQWRSRMLMNIIYY